MPARFDEFSRKGGDGGSGVPSQALDPVLASCRSSAAGREVIKGLTGSRETFELNLEEPQNTVGQTSQLRESRYIERIKFNKKQFGPLRS